MAIRDVCIMYVLYRTGTGITSGVRVLCIRRAGLAVCVWVLFSSRALCVTGASSGPVGVVGSRCCAVALLPLTACPSCTVLVAMPCMSCAGALYNLLCLKVSLTPWSFTACSSPSSPSLRARRMSRHSTSVSWVRRGRLGLRLTRSLVVAAGARGDEAGAARRPTYELRNGSILVPALVSACSSCPRAGGRKKFCSTRSHQQLRDSPAQATSAIECVGGVRA